MKKWFALVLVLGLVSGANAALTLVGVPTEPIGIGEIVTITVANDVGGSYSGWLEIETPAVADFASDPEFTPAANPSGMSEIKLWPEFGASYEFSIISFPPSPAIGAGEHVVVHLVGVSEGSTQLSLYASDRTTLLDQCTIAVIPEPMTVALLGIGGLLLRRRK